jgi:hypothetical protein
MKSLPLILHADGTATLTLRYFYKDDKTNEELPAEEKQFVFTATQVSEILDVPARQGMSRREDLNSALYTWLVVNGFVQHGTVVA